MIKSFYHSEHLFVNLFHFSVKNSSWQKAEIEKNHEFIRYVIPKGLSFDSLTHDDVTLLMNHINSIKRPSLGNKSPYEMIPKGDEDWEWLMQLT